jgi:hypothetical protein
MILLMMMYSTMRVRLTLFTKDKVAVQFNGSIITFSFENPVYVKPL